MPVAHADRLYAMLLRGVGPDSYVRTSDSNEYPQFLAMRAAVKGDAELVAASGVDRTDLTFGYDQEMEKAHCQFVSGWLFRTFGLSPVLGRLLTEEDDLNRRRMPTRCFLTTIGPTVLDKIAKSSAAPFESATTFTKLLALHRKASQARSRGHLPISFLPAMMFEGATHDDWSWIRTFIQMKPGGNRERVRDRLQAIWTTRQTERA